MEDRVSLPPSPFPPRDNLIYRKPHIEQAIGHGASALNLACFNEIMYCNVPEELVIVGQRIAAVKHLLDEASLKQLRMFYRGQICGLTKRPPG